ncbi:MULTISPECIES: hypothetical protein [unclassified Streptomyces]|uniref:hypothetical protein n=1 Tax=unclassified Streptomyces TaxID=2593676 RepID=UPI002E19B31D|nr:MULTISPECIES: hypothetical protein [unclassified Streptomyces]
MATALETAPKKPAFTDRLQANGEDLIATGTLSATHLTGGVVKSLTDVAKLARTFNPLDPYNLTHPAQAYAQQQMALAGLTNLATHPEQLPRRSSAPAGRATPARPPGSSWGT